MPGFTRPGWLDRVPLDRVPPWAWLTGLTLVRLLVAGLTPLSPDECYYWVWSRTLAGGYLDHPPMVALWIRLGTWLAGDTPLGVRLLAPLAAALGSVALASAARDLLQDRRAALTAVALMNATLLFGVGSVTMTPDTPLLLFWTLALAALARLAAGLGDEAAQGRNWLLFGAMAGLAMDSKYTAALLAPAVLVWLLIARGMRVWLGRWQLWAGMLLGLAAFSGVMVWNARHGWASFAKQGGRAQDWQPARAAQFVGELIGGQFGLATPLLAVMFAAGVAAAWRGGRDPASSLLVVLTVVPASAFLEHALGDRVQANWPAILYPSAAIAAAGLAGFWARLQRPAVTFGFVLTAVVWIQGVLAPLPLPRALDPTLMRLGGWDGFAAAIAAQAAAERAAFVAADNYGQAAILARLLPDTLPVVGVEPRWATFDLPSGRTAMAGRIGLLVQSARRGGAPDPAPWSRIEESGAVVRSRGGVIAETYRLYRVTGDIGSAAASAVLPRPR